MAKEQVVRLFRDSQTDLSLREDLNQSSSVEEFVNRASQLGYDFTVKEWQDSMRFSVEELECQLSAIPGI
jgi:hypothetical protein